MSQRDNIVAEALRGQAEREKGYRDKALKMFPHVCARCTREFSGKNLKELTVHHRDHNHDNNPPDGSNWELLCIYCHDHEHQKMGFQDEYGDLAPAKQEKPTTTHQPFAALADLLKNKD